MSVNSRIHELQSSAGVQSADHLALDEVGRRHRVDRRRSVAARSNTPNRDRAKVLLARLSKGKRTVGYFQRGTIQLRLHGVIAGPNGDFTASDVEALLSRHASAERIECHIDSPGGDFEDAVKIYDQLRSHRATVHTIAGKQCASAATIILMAGEFRQAESAASYILLHRTAINPKQTSRWTSRTHTMAAKRLVDADKKMLDIYALRTLASRSVLAKEMNDDKRLPVAVAAQWGVIHCLVGEEQWKNGRPYYWY